MTDSWVETTSIGTLRSDDLARAGRASFATTTTSTGPPARTCRTAAWARSTSSSAATTRPAPIERVVGKVFHSNYLYQLRTDEVTRRDHHNNLAAMARIAAIEHPNILPTYVSAPIADNYLFVTPRMGMTLLEAIAQAQPDAARAHQAARAGARGARRRCTRRGSSIATSRCATSSSTTARTSPTCSTSISRCRSTTSATRPTAPTTRAASSARPAGRSRPRRSTRR